MNNYYVYSHNNIETGKCFYIGIGKGDRVFDGGSKRNRDWRKYVWDNNGYKFQILVNAISKEKALHIERLCINKIGLENLCNIVGEGGNSTAFKKGQVAWNKGLKNAQAVSSKKVMYENKIFESVQNLRNYLKISQTTYYRRISKGTLSVKYV